MSDAVSGETANGFDSPLDSPPESRCLPWQRDQKQREAYAESLLIDTGIGEASIWVSLKTFDHAPGDSDCYRRLGETPQQVIRRQTILENTGRKQ